MIWLLACGPVHDVPSGVERTELIFPRHPETLQPFDTLQVHAEIREEHPTLGTIDVLVGFAEPLLVDDAGQQIALVPRGRGWTAPGGLPDPSVIVGLRGAWDLQVELNTPYVLRVGDVGLEAVDIEPGHTVVLRDHDAVPESPSLVQDEAMVRVLQVEQERIELQLIWTPMDAPPCVIGQDWARWDGAVARWALDPVDVRFSPYIEPVSLREAWLEIPFGRDGSVAGGGGGGWVDLREVEANYPDQDDLCQTLAGLGTPCTPCEDGHQQCLEMGWSNLRAESSAEDIGALDVCGPVLSDHVGPVEVDAHAFGDCTCNTLSGGTLAAGAAWLALLLIRRRRDRRDCQ